MTMHTASSSRLAALRHAPALLAALLLSACGGGSSGGAGTTTTTTTTTSTTTSTSTVTTTPTPSTTVAPVIAGVAAIGAPLLGATIRVVDGAGLPVMLADGAGGAASSALTNTADGSYRITLAAPAPVMPLFIQASGRDMRGLPVVLHSVVQANTAPAEATAHISPLTDAVVAELLGAHPRAVFQNAAANVPALAALGNATLQATAMDHIRTVVAPALADAKVTDKTVNFFKDPAFAANKTGVDGALEGLRIQLRTDSAGKDLLVLSNKMTPPGAEEVRIDLAAAKAELAKTTGGSVAKAITSTAKATSAPGTSVTAVGTLDTLPAAINKLIAAGAPAESFAPMIAATPAPSVPAAATAAYLYNGRTAAMLKDKLAKYAANNYQLGKFQVTGCADDPLAAGKPCVYLNVAANVTGPDGKLIEVFTDAVANIKTPAAGAPAWQLAGNGRIAEVALYPAVYAAMDFAGRATGAAATGVQVAIRAKNEDGSAGIPSALVQLPSGFTVRYADCGAEQLCAAAKADAKPGYTGMLDDTLIQVSVVSGVGQTDGAQAAKYVVSTVPASGATLTPTLYLPAELPAAPTLDGLPALDEPLTTLQFIDGTLAWKTWAAKNPNMRIVLVRRIYALKGAILKIADTPVGDGRGAGVKLAPLGVSAVEGVYTLLLGAEDHLGRRYFSKIAETR